VPRKRCKHRALEVKVDKVVQVTSDTLNRVHGLSVWRAVFKGNSRWSTVQIPLKFGGQIVDEVTCARVAAEVRTAEGVRAVGWGETPLSVQWW
jgi:hypothetical protein